MRSKGLIQYLKNLHKFSAVFGLHITGKQAQDIKLPEAITGLEEVLAFDEECRNQVKLPEGTVSSETVQDQKQKIASLKNLKRFFDAGAVLGHARPWAF